MKTQPKERELSGVDSLFLRIEDDNHLMTIASCWVFDGQLSYEKVYSSLEKMIDQFPQLAQRVEKISKISGKCKWANYDEFHIDQHIKENYLPNTDNEEESGKILKKFLSQKISEKLDAEKALWFCDVIHYGNDQSAIFFRVHHCVTDGQGAVRTFLSLATNSPSNELQYAQKPKKPQKNNSIFYSIYLVFLQFFVFFWGFILVNWHFFKILFFFKKNHFRGEIGKNKVIDYVENISLNEIKMIKDHYKVTVNDVMISALTGAIRDSIIKSEGELKDRELLGCIPVSMRKENDWDLGNKVSSAWIWLPLYIEDPVERLNEIHKRMNKLKSSGEPVAGYFLLKNLGNSVLSNLSFSNHLSKMLLNKPHAIFTNVPGPRDYLYFADRKVKYYIPVIPQPGAGGIGIALLSYAEHVTCSILSDEYLFHKQANLPIPVAFRAQIGDLLTSCTK